MEFSLQPCTSGWLQVQESWQFAPNIPGGPRDTKNSSTYALTRRASTELTFVVG